MLKIEDLIKLNYGEEVWENKQKIQIDKELDEIFNKFKGGCSVKFAKLNKGIQEKIDDIYDQN